MILSLLFAVFALVDVVIVSQIEWWSATLFVLPALVVLFRRGSDMQELGIASFVYVFVITLFATTSSLMVLLFANFCAFAVLLVTVAITDKYARSRKMWMLQGVGALAAYILTYQLIMLFSVWGAVKIVPYMATSALSAGLCILALLLVVYVSKLSPGEN